MPRYRSYDDLDDAGAYAGDSAFVGMNSRSNPAVLNAGFVALSKNMRFDRATARPRKGAVAQNIGVKLDHAAVVLPFKLPAEGVQIFNDYDDGARTAVAFHGKVSAPGNLEFTVNRAKIQAHAIYRGREYSMHAHGAETTTSPDKDFIALVFSDKIYLFDPDAGLASKTLLIPDTADIPDSNSVAAVQAFDSLFIFRGKDEHGVYMKPLRWSGIDGDNFTLAPDAKAYHSIPSASFGLYHSERLIVPLEYTVIALDEIRTVPAASRAVCKTSLDTGLKPGMNIVISGANTATLNGRKTIAAVTPQVCDENGNITTPASFEFDCASESETVENEHIEARYSARDEYVVSGILEPLEYDLVDCHFRINKGNADWLVGFAPYQEGSIIVFMRKSIYIHSGLADIANSSLKLITEEVGCVSRRTIATIGSNIYFLSDEGVYSLQIAEQLTLRGAGEPLSRDIDDWIRRVNVSAAQNACAVFCNNRYWLAVPIDSSVRNNAVFVYNTLNSAWESIDTYPQSLYFDELVVATCRGQKRVFAVSREGGIALLEESEAGDEVGSIGAAEYEVVPVKAELLSRAYSFNTPDIKRFNRLQLDIGHSRGDTCAFSVETENPDATTRKWNFGADHDGETTIRKAIRKNAHRAQVRFKTLGGRGELRQIAIEASAKASDNRTT